MIATGQRRPAVLVVDDDLLIRELLEGALADDGYEVRSAEHGEAAVNAVNGWRPDVVVLDLMMPVMSGWEVLDRWSENGMTAWVSVIVLSAAHDLKQQAEGLLALGAKSCLPKPFDLDELLRTVQDLIAAK